MFAFHVVADVQDGQSSLPKAADGAGAVSHMPRFHHGRLELGR
jgi:hypothetical protein